MIIGTGMGLYPSPQMTQPATGAQSASPAAQSLAGNTAQPAMAVQAAAGAPEGGSGISDQTAEERAFAKVMNDRFAQECQTCKSRKYQDGSDDMGVSFQTPTHISPEASFSAVSSHEQEHVSRNKASAEAEGGEVVSSTVVLHGDICPECGRYYIAGGTTYTTTRHGGEQNQNQNENQQNKDPHNHNAGKELNLSV